MLEKILLLIQRLDLKWWISLKAQQMLTLLMSVLIVVFFSTTVMLFIETKTRVSEVRANKNAEIVLIKAELKAEREKTDACNESKFRLVEKYEILFFETKVMRDEINTQYYENKIP